MSDKLPEAWPGLAMQWQTKDKLDPYMATTKPPSRYSSTPAIQRARYCLRSHNGYATENGFTDDPSSAIQLVDKETAMRRIIASGRPDLLPHLVHFQKNGEHWHPIPT